MGNTELSEAVALQWRRGTVVASGQAEVPVGPGGGKADPNCRNGVQSLTSAFVEVYSGVIIWNALTPSVAYIPGKRGQTNLSTRQIPDLPK